MNLQFLKHFLDISSLSSKTQRDLELLHIVIFTLFQDGCKVTEEKQKLL